MRRKNSFMCLMIILGFLLLPMEVAADFNSFDIDLEIQASESLDTTGFYLPEGGHIYIDINTTVIIDIQLKKSEIIDLKGWSNQIGEIRINYTPPFDYGSMYITFYNTESMSGSIEGAIYYGTDIVITTTPTTSTGWTLPPPPTQPPDTGFWFLDWIIIFFTTQNFVNGLFLGGIVGFMMAICIFWRYNRESSTTVLVNVDKNDLMDKEWLPE